MSTWYGDCGNMAVWWQIKTSKICWIDFHFLLKKALRDFSISLIFLQSPQRNKKLTWKTLVKCWKLFLWYSICLEISHVQKTSRKRPHNPIHSGGPASALHNFLFLTAAHPSLYFLGLPSFTLICLGREMFFYGGGDRKAREVRNECQFTCRVSLYSPSI